MTFPRLLLLVSALSVALLLSPVGLRGPASAVSQVPPFHKNPEHRGRVPVCTTCHVSHRGQGPALSKAPTLDAVCGSCHQAGDIARWKTASATFLVGEQADRIIDQLSRVGSAPFDVQGPGTGPSIAP